MNEKGKEMKEWKAQQGLHPCWNFQLGSLHEGYPQGNPRDDKNNFFSHSNLDEGQKL